jgi:hypothetical protein
MKAGKQTVEEQRDEIIKHHKADRFVAGRATVRCLARRQSDEAGDLRRQRQQGADGAVVFMTAKLHGRDEAHVRDERKRVAGSTASGVSTGKACSMNQPSSQVFSASESAAGSHGGGPHSLDRNAGELRETPAGSNSPYPCKGAMKL